MKKILHIIGTRPQIIKLAAIIGNEDPINSKFEHFIIDTNQHYEETMQENLYYDLNIDSKGILFLDNDKIFSNNISSMVSLLVPELEKLNPDIVYIYGDTASTVAGALAAKIKNFLSVHIESGLRSQLPFQVEETNRIIADSICDYLFCPTNTSFDNLKRENNSKKAFIVGDVTLDIFLKTNQKKPQLPNSKLLIKDYFVTTIHRQENIHNKVKLKNIIKSLRSIDKVVIPLHHSLKKQLKSFKLFNDMPDNIEIISPLTYSEMLYLINNSQGVITDSGGLQKDAFWLEKPLITIRSKTEWVETLKNGQNILIDKFPSNLYEQFSNINLVKFNRYDDFGNGNATANILQKTDEILN